MDEMMFFENFTLDPVAGANELQVTKRGSGIFGRIRHARDGLAVTYIFSDGPRLMGTYAGFGAALAVMIATLRSDGQLETS